MDQHGGSLRAYHLGAMGLVAADMGDRRRTFDCSSTNRELLGQLLGWDPGRHWRCAPRWSDGTTDAASGSRSGDNFRPRAGDIGNTRPYEGFVLGGLCALFLLAR